MRNILNGFGRLPLAPFGLPILVSGPIWAANIMRLDFRDMLPIMLAMLGCAALLLVIVRLFVKTWARASLITMIWVGYSLYLPALVRFFTENAIVLVLAMIIGAALAFDISRRVPKEPNALFKANGFANLAILVPALLTLGDLGSQQIELERGRPDPQAVFAALPGKADANSPDVWHIVMDRYAGPDTLRTTYDYDNQPFFNELRKRGFNVNEDAYSNYQITPLSLASTLNADYLDNYAKSVGRKDDLVTMFYAIDRNRAFEFFKRNGYEIVFSGSWADVTVNNSQADRDINFRGASEVPRIALRHSVPGSIGELVGMPYTDGRTDQCKRVQYKFEKLNEVAREPGRKFVFAHFLVPHPPFVLDAIGDCRTIEQVQKHSREEAYVGMVRYANRQLLRLIDSILAGPRPATIILHADEGPYPSFAAYDEPEFKPEPANGRTFTTAGTGIMREKTHILMALRHADGASESAPRTPVNIYPAILNHSFGAQMPMKQDRIRMFSVSPDLGKLEDVSADLLTSTDPQ